MAPVLSTLLTTENRADCIWKRNTTLILPVLRFWITNYSVITQ